MTTTTPERKTALTFEEKITVAFMHYVRGIHQQDLAILYCVNMGRVNEACMAIKTALNEPVPRPSGRLISAVGD